MNEALKTMTPEQYQSVVFALSERLGETFTLSVIDIANGDKDAFRENFRSSMFCCALLAALGIPLELIKTSLQELPFNKNVIS